MLACAGGRNQPLVSLSMHQHPEYPHARLQVEGPRAHRPARRAHRDDGQCGPRVIDLPRGVHRRQRNHVPRLRQGRRAGACMHVRFCAGICARASGCACMRTLRSMCAWRVRSCARVYCYVWPHTLLCSDLLVGCRRYVRSSRKKSPNSVTRQSSRAPTQRGSTMCNI